jgi:hypothetical protein
VHFYELAKKGINNVNRGVPVLEANWYYADINRPGRRQNI